MDLFCSEKFTPAYKVGPVTSYRVITPLIGVKSPHLPIYFGPFMGAITPFVTGWGPPCRVQRFLFVTGLPARAGGWEERGLAGGYQGAKHSWQDCWGFAGGGRIMGCGTTGRGWYWIYASHLEPQGTEKSSMVAAHWEGSNTRTSHVECMVAEHIMELPHNWAHLRVQVVSWWHVDTSGANGEIGRLSCSLGEQVEALPRELCLQGCAVYEAGVWAYGTQITPWARTGKGKWRGLNPFGMMELGVPIQVEDVIYVLRPREVAHDMGWPCVEKRREKSEAWKRSTGW